MSIRLKAALCTLSILAVLSLLLLLGGCGSQADPVAASAPFQSSQSAGDMAPASSVSDGSSVSEAAALPPDPPEADPFDSLEAEEEGQSTAENTPPAAETRNRAEIKADMLAGIEEWKSINADTVGWLYVPDTTLDCPVFQTTDNLFYLAHNDYKKEDKNGAILADHRDRFGGRDSQSQNLVLYGHSKDENPDGGVEASREYEHFTELKRYQDIEFCRKNPYVMFAADGDAMVWEIFAVFHTKTDFYYIRPNPTAQEMRDILTEARGKSLFNFSTAVSDTDRILTLSTCCRRIVPTYPNGYRFVVMARLVEKGKPLTYDCPIEPNPGGLSPDNIY